MAVETIPRERSDAIGSRVTLAESKAMLKTVLNLLDRWGLSRAEKLVVLGGPSERTFQRWRAGDIGPLPTDTVRLEPIVFD